VIPYYERFIERFPNFEALATASEAELLAAWAGLGYYYRARNLQKAAQVMRAAGAFPSTYKEIRALPGVGDYTAAAVASIAFSLPYPALDGNVLRVLSRLLDDDSDIASKETKNYFSELASRILDRRQPGTFNQAMMELGATLCLPKNPQCLLCPVSSACRALRTGRQNDLPLKRRAQKAVQEKRRLFWIERDGKLLLWRRKPDARLMPGFWELPERSQLPDLAVGRSLGSFRHGITFHDYLFEVSEAEPPVDCGSCEWVAIDELMKLPASTVLRKAISLRFQLN
jgi:A/G-specific adenine glycosylase